MCELWNNCTLFGGYVICVIVLDVRVMLCVSCVSWLCCELLEGCIVCGLCCIWIMLGCVQLVLYVEVLCWRYLGRFCYLSRSWF